MPADRRPRLNTDAVVDDFDHDRFEFPAGALARGRFENRNLDFRRSSVLDHERDRRASTSDPASIELVTDRERSRDIHRPIADDSGAMTPDDRLRLAHPGLEVMPQLASTLVAKTGDLVCTTQLDRRFDPRIRRGDEEARHFVSEVGHHPDPERHNRHPEEKTHLTSSNLDGDETSTS
jgi:hypothetical protein